MAKLLNRSFTREEKRQILDMLQGNINRISVSNDIEEIVCQLNFAVDRISSVAYSRIKELSDRDNPRKIEFSAGAPICPVCGRKVIKCYNFCPDCGQRLEQ